MTIPMIWGILAVIGNSVVDTFFLSRLGTGPLSAISFAFPVMMVISSLAIGLGAGAASVVARAIGAGDQHLVRRRSTDALSLSVILVALVVSLGLVTIEPVFRSLGATPDTLVLIDQYMSIWYWGMPFLVVPMVGNSLIRASGDARIPGLIMIMAAVVNMILDPLLIFGLLGFPRMEVEGAALATVIANAATSLAALAVLQYREKMLDWHWPRWSEVMESWRRIAYVGLPAAAANMVNPAGLTVITALLARHGEQTVAAFGLATRIEAVAVVTMFALSATIGPIVGQNYGAGLQLRVQGALVRAYQLCLKWGLAAAVVLALLAPLFLPRFSDEPQVVDLARYYLWIVPVTFFGYGINITAAAALNAVGRPLHATSLTLLRMVVVYIPLALFLGQLMGALGVFIAAALANLIGGVASWLLSRTIKVPTVRPPAGSVAAG